ncbi:glycosyltransferase [Chishuiella sp.]|uniref:glycosyltransferase family 2 protein n=1 Tax=Chishuiella sp. TaxID=1969467 RepID=UPI0028ADC6D0|nr:glycosyltransferase [Chishuiella sp.]
MQIPLISVCIPTYNGEKFLQEALDSVKHQTYKNIEVIISDDLSKDNTLEIAEKFKNEVEFPVYIYSHQPNGIGANWNNCIQKSNGKYIQFLFQDDILESNSLEVKLNFIKKYNLKAVCSKRLIINDRNEIVTTGVWYRYCYDLQKLYLNLEFNNFYLFTKKDLNRITFKDVFANIFGEPIAFLFDKTLFEEIAFFNTSYKQILDIEYAYRILKKYPIGLIEEPLFKFRLHEAQASSVNSTLNNHDEYKYLKKYIIKNFYEYLSFDFKKNIIKDKFHFLYLIYHKIRYFNNK